MVLIWLIKIILFCIGLGVAIGILYYVPLFIYTIPYHWWVGGEICAGRQLDKKNEPFKQSVKNARRLYKARRKHQEPVF